MASDKAAPPEPMREVVQLYGSTDIACAGLSGAGLSGGWRGSGSSLP